MPVLDVADQSLVAIGPHLVAADPWGPCRVGRWLPGLALAEVSDRGDEGRLWRAWAVTGEVDWRGTAEVWLQPWHDSTVVHLYVRLDPSGDRDPPAGQVARWRMQLVDRWKLRLGQWREVRTGGREPGTAALKVAVVTAES